jgi:hypothetical protein
MSYERGIVFNLDQVGFDPYGRVIISDRQASQALGDILSYADAISCRSGCGAPLSCDTALITSKELFQNGPDLMINNADFAAIIRKRKAVDAREAVIVFSIYKKMKQAHSSTQMPN